MNLVSAIRELEKEIRLKEKIHNTEIAKMNDVLDYLKENNDACEKCEGKKVVMRRPNILAEPVELICNACNGIGKKINTEKPEPPKAPEPQMIRDPQW